VELCIFSPSVVFILPSSKEFSLACCECCRCHELSVAWWYFH